MRCEAWISGLSMYTSKVVAKEGKKKEGREGKGREGKGREIGRAHV